MDLGISVDHGDDQAVTGVGFDDIWGVRHIVGGNRDLDGLASGCDITGGFNAARSATTA